MPPDALLTQDELDFIRNMQQNAPANPLEVQSSMTVDSGVQVKDLLTRLMANEHVTIQAQFENQQMSFPLELVEDEFHAVHLHVGAPSIFEDGPMVRPWRMALEAPLALLDHDGSRTDLWVIELSFKGVLLELREHAEAPTHFALMFQPPGHDPIALQGSFERMTQAGHAAYRLSEANASETERLRQYLLQQHRLAHPNLHT